MSGTEPIERQPDVAYKYEERGPLPLTETVSIRLTARDVRRLNAVASEQHVPVSTIIRRLTHEWLGAHEWSKGRKR